MGSSFLLEPQIVLLAKWHAGDRIRLYDDRRLNTP
jgi:hypothetical protein